MGNAKNTRPVKADKAPDPAEAERRMAAYLRAASAYEHEMITRAVQPLGLPELCEELGRPRTAAAMNGHHLLEDHYPLHIDVRLTGRSNPPPVPWSKPLPKLARMAFEFPDTAFHAMCVTPKEWNPARHSRGYAVVFAYDGEGSLILHNKPDLTEGTPLVSGRLPNGCPVQIHWFEPFIDDVADACRYDLAEDGSALMHKIESNHPFRLAYWADYEDRVPPGGR